MSSAGPFAYAPSRHSDPADASSVGRRGFLSRSRLPCEGR
ncbi:hypothetical protein GA0115243_101234 [Streptomyces sp. ScaeMP-e83]|nr:hypothetical protein GA0115243_101234 [Streptomyces sp. ScaeMP-e83]